MSKHTPGPWKFSGVSSAGRRIYHSTDTTVYHICTIPESDPGNPKTVDTMDADARLISAAPEMLEALKSARGWVATHAMQTYSRVASKELEAIDALIAKAEGRES